MSITVKFPASPKNTTRAGTPMLSSSRSSLKRSHSYLLKKNFQCTSVVGPRCPRRHASTAIQSAEPSSSTELRSAPFKFEPDTAFQQSRHGTTLARCNTAIHDAFKRRDIRSCFEAAANMKKNGIAPDATTYNALLLATAYGTNSLDAFAVYEDMVSCGVEPNVATFNHLIFAVKDKTTTQVWFILDLMAQKGIRPNGETYQLIVQFFTAGKNVEIALQFLHEMKLAGFEPSLQTVRDIVIVVAEQGYSRLAVDLATEFEANSIRRLGPEPWLSCLVASAEDVWDEGVLRCWDIVVKRFNINPDEGLCLAVLTTAARHGLSDLATEVLGALKTAGVQWREYHVAPLVEALCRADRLKEAILSLNIMRSNNILPLPSTALPISEIISKDVDALDSVWPILDELQEEKATIDVIALNAIIEAAVALGDLQRAVGTYKSFSDYNVVPDRDTFRTLLDGSIVARHLPLGTIMLEGMKELDIAPDATTFRQMIELCLTQEVYDDAFLHLEEMKDAGFKPTQETYEAIVVTCASRGDYRYDIAMKEMQEQGYPIAKDFEVEVSQIYNRSLVAANGHSESEEFEQDDGGYRR
ncbi:uncharacterized protein ARMOST_13518 [Armillaria ostoyae]|uniref:Pentatricopeptide repeat-containing protein-mitochondrial domain-containing protein n=1 Tax=Armillaria ostoyae TaxID=47428 RepID=A0A284RN39_ARMOS|nr:uncharacterized protein ARMOST_13518 [Armillaria ostoyae]